MAFYHGKGTIRFHCNTLASFQAICPRIPRTVMYIQPNIVTQMVREECANCLMGQSSVTDANNNRAYISRHVKPKLLQLIPQSIFGDCM